MDIIIQPSDKLDNDILNLLVESISKRICQLQSYY